MKMIGSKAEVERADGRARILSRQEERERGAAIAFDAAQRRQARARSNTVAQRVDAAKGVLKGRSVADSFSIIDAVRPLDRDIYLIAEEAGAARKSVLVRYGKIRKDVQEQYVSEVGLKTPEQTPDGAEE